MSTIGGPGGIGGPKGPGGPEGPDGPDGPEGVDGPDGTGGAQASGDIERAAPTQRRCVARGQRGNLRGERPRSAGRLGERAESCDDVLAGLEVVH